MIKFNEIDIVRLIAPLSDIWIERRGYPAGTEGVIVNAHHPGYLIDIGIDGMVEALADEIEREGAEAN